MLKKAFAPFEQVAVFSENQQKWFPDIYQRHSQDGHYVIGCSHLIKDENIRHYPKNQFGIYMDPDQIPHPDEPDYLSQYDFEEPRDEYEEE